MSSGTVFNIEHYAIHDGPGIRTTVFFKGCPLNCLWCHNPEGLSAKPQIVQYRDRCINCRRCADVCPQSAVTATINHGIVIDREKCTACGLCARACPVEAIEKIGRTMSADQIISEVEKDRMFYDESGGGVTFSGGEPLFQPQFLLDCLRLAKEKRLDTALETSCFASRETVENVAHYVDLWLLDMKPIIPQMHKKYTGVDNASIKKNIEYLSQQLGARIILRMVVIPGVNDDSKTISCFTNFLKKLKSVEAINLLPLHKTASEKYRRLGKKFGIEDFVVPDEFALGRMAAVYRENGFKVLIGGQ